LHAYHFREIFVEMLDSVKHPFSDCIEHLRKNIRLDPHFEEFFSWARGNGIPVIVLSSGMEPIIRTLLTKLLGPAVNDLDIICNECVDRPGMKKEQPGGWTVQFHDDSGFGHDKSLTIRPYAEHFDENPDAPRATLLFAGDGVSDLSAAKETDLLFAKKGKGERRQDCSN
jgi:2,3-diketo-5-methylthio-1-phosphopentane phosphatase